MTIYIYWDYQGLLHIRNLKAKDRVYKAGSAFNGYYIHWALKADSKPFDHLPKLPKRSFPHGPGTPLTSTLSNAGLHRRIFNNTARSNVPDADRASVGIGSPFGSKRQTCVWGHQHCCHTQACRLHSATLILFLHPAMISESRWAS